MFKNYFKIAFRNLVKNKVFSIINIAGLAIGMMVAMLIGLWIWDEVSFNKGSENYHRIASVMQQQTFNGEVSTRTSVPYLTGDELRKNFGGNFKYVTMSSWTEDHILAFEEKKVTKTGNYFEPEIAEMLTLKMLSGTRHALNNIHSILLSQSTAKALFGNDGAMGKLIKIDNNFTVKVTGVYKDLPYNSDFKNLLFIAPWQLYIDNETWPEKLSNPWRSNAFQTLVQLNDNADINKVSAGIKDIKLRKLSPAEAVNKPSFFLQPLSKWHLYSEFKNGVNTGGRIQYVWMFGGIGIFILLLACINFMNLSTARSEKRAKEVGVRKAIGSLRGQLIGQFFSESILAAFIAFLLALIMVQISLPYFNEIADKKISIPWSHSFFWAANFIFCLITGLVAGMYPALYLSSFKPVKVLKGTYRAGRFSFLPRKVLVVLQFTFTFILITGTVVIFRQIQMAKNRPVGYTRTGLLSIPLNTNDLTGHYNLLRNDLLKTGAVSEIAQSSSPVTRVRIINSGFEWKGKQPNIQGNFGTISVSHDFGNTIGWQFAEGRDFSRNFNTDSSAIILNEAAVQFMGLQHPVGEQIKEEGKMYHVIGVVKDLVMGSPYEQAFRTIFILDYQKTDYITVKINNNINMQEALAKIGIVFLKYNPAQPFEYKFIDEDYAKKFGDEERIGKLAGIFALIAIFISCMGLFGMASFISEQRTKEIGLRKVMGASVFNLWRLLSIQFLGMVIISLCIGMPVTYYLMHQWLQNYHYHTELSLWLFLTVGIGTLLITLATVSFQAIKAAIANPIKSLRTE